MAAEYELTLNDYLEILRRRTVLIVVTFAVILSGSLAVAVMLSPVYESTGTILIESPQVPADLVETAISTYADERIAVIKQRVMTRENLQKSIEKYHLYKDERSKMTGSEVIDLMRDNINIELVRSTDDSGSPAKKKQPGAIAFTVSFDYKDAKHAHKVANELVTLFLDENVKSRTEKASETTEFLKQEVERQKVALEKSEALVADYKRQHGNALPEQMELQMSMLQRTEEDLRTVEREYKTAQAELKLMEVDLAGAKAGVNTVQTPQGVGQPGTELEKAKAEYTKLIATYTENHPSVRAMKRRIEALEKSETASVVPAGQDSKSTAAVSPALNYQESRIQTRIDMAKAQISAMAQQQANLRAKIKQLEGQLTQVPQVELGLNALMRDHEIAKKKYDEVVSKLTNAKISENVESENKSEHFTLLEPPQVPEKPIKPNRPKIAFVGFILSILGSVGLTLLLESFNQRVRGMDAITMLLGHRPLVAIPYITTEDEDRKSVV